MLNWTYCFSDHFGSMYMKVTVEYKEESGCMIPLRVHAIVISIQHSPDVSMDQMKADLREKVIKVH